MIQAEKLLIVITAALVGVSHGAGCNGKSTPGPQNLNPTEDAAPILVKSVANGKLQRVNTTTGVEFDVVHLWGTPYEMGYAQGVLQAEKAKGFLNDVTKYIEDQVVKPANRTDFFGRLERFVVDVGVQAALEASYLVTKKYTPAHFDEEIAGLAAGIGLPLGKVRGMQYIPEITEGKCSMFGAWGNAIPDGDTLLQLRSLDWDVDGPFKDYPQVTVYHPTPDANGTNGHAFATVGYTSFIATVTGVSSAPLAISEIGVTYPDSSFGKSDRYLYNGYPYGFMLRDILQFDETVDDAITRITSAKRTAELILGVGDGNLAEFRGFQYSRDVARVFDDRNLAPVAPYHPRIDDVVYWGMDWICPNDNQMISDQIKKNYGKLTPEVAIRDIMPVVQTGDLHIALYDFTRNDMYVSFARPSWSNVGPALAYDRPFARISLPSLWNETKPTTK